MAKEVGVKIIEGKTCLSTGFLADAFGVTKKTVNQLSLIHI